MANKYKDLRSLFGATADAIRAKTGETGKIIADDFPEKIGMISAGASVDVQKRNSDIVSYTLDISYTNTARPSAKLIAIQMAQYFEGKYAFRLYKNAYATTGTAFSTPEILTTGGEAWGGILESGESVSLPGLFGDVVLLISRTEDEASDLYAPCFNPFFAYQKYVSTIGNPQIVSGYYIGSFKVCYSEGGDYLPISGYPNTSPSTGKRYIWPGYNDISYCDDYGCLPHIIVDGCTFNNYIGIDLNLTGVEYQTTVPTFN